MTSHAKRTVYFFRQQIRWLVNWVESPDTIFHLDGASHVATAYANTFSHSFSFFRRNPQNGNQLRFLYSFFSLLEIMRLLHLAWTISIVLELIRLTQKKNILLCSFVSFDGATAAAAAAVGSARFQRSSSATMPFAFIQIHTYHRTLENSLPNANT